MKETMKKIFNLCVIILVSTIFLAGCANRIGATIDPSTKLSNLKTMVVKVSATDNTNTHMFIADSLRAKGVTVSTDAKAVITNYDALVTYIENWKWDMSMYLLELTVTLRDPKTEKPLATGNAYHTSLTRRSPKEMSIEVVDAIYKDAK